MKITIYVSMYQMENYLQNIPSGVDGIIMKYVWIPTIELEEGDGEDYFIKISYPKHKIRIGVEVPSDKDRLTIMQLLKKIREPVTCHFCGMSIHHGYGAYYITVNPARAYIDLEFDVDVFKRILELLLTIPKPS